MESLVSYFNPWGAPFAAIWCSHCSGPSLVECGSALGVGKTGQAAAAL